MPKTIFTILFVFICAAAALAQSDGAAAGTSDGGASTSSAGRKGSTSHN